MLQRKLKDQTAIAEVAKKDNELMEKYMLKASRRQLKSFRQRMDKLKAEKKVSAQARTHNHGHSILTPITMTGAYGKAAQK